MKRLLVLSTLLVSLLISWAQDIPEHISYSRIYEFLDELATDGFIRLNSTVKPYSRTFIAMKLLEAESKELGQRQRKELEFFLRDFAPELNKLPDARLSLLKSDRLSLAAWQPAFHYCDSAFRTRIVPLLGMHISSNNNGEIIKRWYGVDFQSMLGRNLSVYGSLRDISIQGALIARPSYLNDYPGYEYKESSAGGDFSDSRGGITYSWKSGSVGLVKDNVVWGDNYHGSNILSGRAPSFPMLKLHLKPVKWFEMNYLHGWLVSNVVDSGSYYVDNTGQKLYRMTNKFLSANMFTFTPVRNLNISFGNSIVYAERNIQPGYLLPVAFYKSIDHTLTKGLNMENQNSQMFFNVSSRNIRHLHLFSSVYADEFSISRLGASNPERNPVSIKIGAFVSNFPVRNLSFTAEYTRTDIITYKHSIPALTWASNGYNLGNYMGDNSQELYLALGFKPLRGLDIQFSMVDAKHGNEFDYLRRTTDKVDNSKIFLSQPFLDEISWSNKTFGLHIRYELMNNAYAILNAEQSDIRAYDLSKTPVKLDEAERLYTAEQFLNLFGSSYLQGKHTTFTVGFGFGF